MSRYIDAESLVAKVKKHLNPHTDEFGMVSVEEADRWFLSLIESEPTADVIVCLFITKLAFVVPV